jgi:6-phosphogluconolactonase
MNRSPYNMQVFPDGEAVSRAAAELFVARAGKAIRSGRRFCVALSGGSTPRRTYELLASDYRAKVSWREVEIFWSDERTVALDDPASNFGMARAAMLDHLGLAPAQVHRMAGERDDCAAAARDYEAELARVFKIPPATAPPMLDLVLLGMGADGHTASLVPHTRALSETQRWVV